jgi:protein TonB
MSTQINETVSNYVEPIDTKMEYGLPELKKVYRKFLSRGLIIAVIIHGIFISMYCISLYIDAQAEKNLQIKRDIELKDLMTQDNAKDESDQPPPPEVEPQKIEALKDLAALTPEPVAKEKADLETIKKVEETEKIKAFVSSEGSENFDPTKETGKVTVQEKKVEENIKHEETKVTKEKTYQQFEVDKAPVCVNLSQVQGSMRYPEIARSTGIEGRITVKVLVGPDGSVVSVGGVSGQNAEVFRDEVSSKVMSLQFTPALQQGQPVRCWVSVPFNFKLSGKFKKDDEGDKKEEPKKEEKKEEGK